MSTSSPPYNLRAPSLLFELRQRPGLLLRELLWRWGCGGLLLLLACYEGSRIWTALLPALQATGVLAVTPDTLIQDPDGLLTSFQAALSLLWPPVARACLGLAPLAAFCWVGAFALGRSAVLAHYDPALPRRTWLLAEAEAWRVAGQAGILGLWAAANHGAYRWLMGGDTPHVLGYGALVLLASAVALPAWIGFRRSMFMATALALTEGVSFRGVWMRGLRLLRAEAVRPLRRVIRRIRLLLFATGLLLMLVPDPFPFGWRLLAWWLLLSLPSLAVTDAWRLGAFLLIVQGLEERARLGGRAGAPATRP